MIPNQYYLAGSFTDTISMALTDEVTYAVAATLELGVLDRVGIQVTVAGAGSAVRLGVYDDAGGFPGNLVLDAGTVNTTTIGTKQVTVDCDVAFGRYWLTATLQGGTPPEILAGLAPPWSELPQGTSAPSDATWAHSLTETGVSGALSDPFGSVGTETDFGPQIFYRYEDDVVTPPADPVTPTVLTVGGSDEPTDTFVTETITPSEDALVLVAFSFVGDDIASGTYALVSGCGLTFGPIAAFDDNTVNVNGAEFFHSAAVFRAMGTPTEGAITIEFPGPAEYCLWYVLEFPAVETSGTNGENAYELRGLWIDEPGTSNMDYEMNFGGFTFDDPANAAFSVYMLPADREVTATGDWVSLGSQRLEGKGTIHAQWQPTEDANQMSTANVDVPTEYGSFALEIVRA